jgi:hypothetical protein
VTQCAKCGLKWLDDRVCEHRVTPETRDLVEYPDDAVCSHGNSLPDPDCGCGC